MLPWAGIACLAAAAWHYGRSESHWPWLAIAGVALIVLDVVIDFILSSISRSDQPHLNARAAQLVGRTVTLVEPIEGGIGKVRCDDTLWQVEGIDLPAGTTVRVVGAKGMRLVVEHLHSGEDHPRQESGS